MDYIAVSETLVFVPGGPTRMCVTFSVFDDQMDEINEFFTLILNGPVPPPVIAIITIVDNGKYKGPSLVIALQSSAQSFVLIYFCMYNYARWRSTDRDRAIIIPC